MKKIKYVKIVLKSLFVVTLTISPGKLLHELIIHLLLYDVATWHLQRIRTLSF